MRTHDLNVNQSDILDVKSVYCSSWIHAFQFRLTATSMEGWIYFVKLGSQLDPFDCFMG